MGWLWWILSEQLPDGLQVINESGALTLGQHYCRYSVAIIGGWFSASRYISKWYFRKSYSHWLGNFIYLDYITV